MKLPSSLFISAVQEKKVFYFSSSRINSTEPHFFVCIKRTNDELLIFSCCTSKFENKRRYIESRNLPRETLVYIKPKEDGNPFVRDTYVNCNECHIYTVQEFEQKYNSNQVEYSGEISDVYYEQIIIGIQKSPLISQETKNLIPNIFI